MNQTDVIIVGAGPCGLFQAFQLGLQGLQCHLIEALPYAGGQCAELYPDKPIYDIPGIPVVMAGELSDQLCEQLRPFQPVFHFSQTVEAIEPAEGRFTVQTSTGTTLSAESVVIATGAGAFTPVKLRVEGIERFENKHLFYAEAESTHTSLKQVAVTGDTPSAIDTAISIAASSEKTTLIHRKRRLQMEPHQQAQIAELEQADKLQLVNGKILAAAGETALESLTVQLKSREELTLTVDTLLARLGSSPKSNAFDQWNLSTERNLLGVDAADFSTNLDGTYAIGDINTYPGKRKLILCGFHEATLTAFAIAKKRKPSEPIHTLYTTTSTVLQQRLGVA
jgi:thioredoxin reductase (NADPH)